jgi:hypothetical protein
MRRLDGSKGVTVDDNGIVILQLTTRKGQYARTSDVQSKRSFFT